MNQKEIKKIIHITFEQTADNFLNNIFFCYLLRDIEPDKECDDLINMLFKMYMRGGYE